MRNETDEQGQGTCLPLSLVSFAFALSGLYLLGINVGGIPGNEYPHGFMVVCLLMLGLGCSSGGFSAACD